MSFALRDYDYETQGSYFARGRGPVLLPKGSEQAISFLEALGAVKRSDLISILKSLGICENPDLAIKTLMDIDIISVFKTSSGKEKLYLTTYGPQGTRYAPYILFVLNRMGDRWVKLYASSPPAAVTFSTTGSDNATYDVAVFTAEELRDAVEWIEYISLSKIKKPVVIMVQKDGPVGPGAIEALFRTRKNIALFIFNREAGTDLWIDAVRRDAYKKEVA